MSWVAGVVQSYPWSWLSAEGGQPRLCQAPLQSMHSVEPWAAEQPTVVDRAGASADDAPEVDPPDLDEGGARAIRRAYVEVFEPLRIAIGHDRRLSAPGMTDAVILGASETGADVLELGLIGTE